MKKEVIKILKKRLAQCLTPKQQKQIKGGDGDPLPPDSEDYVGVEEIIDP